ncbi:iron ABC transporter permease [Bosea sp. (in: a-proteobacteria)]|uniref:ABC transporter permease n=1 Tax=Bosea sp. (in: a-proteobacteria) TaxID=1871050 RepID=UPI002604CB90|nr:iron ABC transporter permease [Bosea sp. (in: a-proteobacteria)]MCO5089597.1 iron ABC transporter permease [Bosea sp. (in: a-proteobacteria)]
MARRLALSLSLPRWALLLAIIWLAGLPVLAVFVGSMQAGTGGGFTTSHLQKVFLTTSYLPALVSTLELGLYVGLGSTFVGTVIAWLMSRLRPPGGFVLEIGIMAPIFISPFIGAVGWLTLGQSQTGMLNVALRALGLPGFDIISYWGAVFIMALFFVPYAYSLVRHSLDRLNPELEEAAAICGAGPIRTALGVVLPLLWPSLLSAVIIIFVLAAEMFSIPGLLLVPYGYEVLSYIIYDRTTHWPIDYGEASAVGLILLLVTAFGMLLYALSIRVQERFVTVGPRSPRVGSAGGFDLKRTLALGAILFFILLSCILPIGAIALRALLPYFSGSFAFSDLTWSNINTTFSDRLAITSLRNSLIVTVVSTVLLLTLAFLVALGRVRYRDRISTLTWIIASIPVAVPGVLVGVGLIWLYIGTPVYATISIIVLVMLARFLPMLVRLFETGLLQLGKELEEAAFVCGASNLTVTREIRLPLLAGTIRSAATIGGTQVFNELTASALLFTSASSVLPVVIFNYMFDGDYSRATALALVQVAIVGGALALTGIAVLIIRLWRNHRRRPA